ncbi:MAG: aminotransferase class I/II-fold pyridoxal phosphate-dependent enzyme, partial [Chitinivibrionales bacterium]|nr:aminotransferase class I/II-fold pyridoxal phosphate-dependent enzyme [Chitinivibrionales bacterium]
MSLRNEILPFSPPLIGDEEIEAVVDTLRSGWITTGPKTARFEKAFATYLGAQNVLALSSCTAGLHITLTALGIGNGDEVITTAMTFPASVSVVEHVRARPVLVDVEPDTLNIDVAQLEAAVSSATKAIIVVHYAGHPVDLDPIGQIARNQGIPIIEDAAHAVSAKYKGRPIGSNGNPVSFSFYATKNLTTSEGGVLSGEKDFLDRARIISLHGISKDAWRRRGTEGSWYYEVISPGFKYNMTDIQAAIGLCQLKKLDAFQRRRRQVVDAYNRAFSEMGVF